jgi:hypothetical protein
MKDNASGRTAREDVQTPNRAPQTSSHVRWFKPLIGIVHDVFDQGDFIVLQFRELAFTAGLRQGAVVLPNKHHEVFRKTIRHLDGIHDSLNRFVMPSEIVDFVREIMLYSPPHAGVQELSGGRAIKIAIEIAGIVENLDIAIGCGAIR